MKVIFASVILLVMTFSALGQGGIRAVDFKNFTYSPYCVGEEPRAVTVKNGEFSEEKQEDGYVDRFYFSVFDIVYGDLTGDRQDEAVVLTVCNTGGTGNFSEGFVYTIKAGKPDLVTRIPGGDRAYGGLKKTRIENGSLLVESYDVGEMGGACCPEFVVTSKYRISGNKLVKLGPETRLPLVPTSRVSFARGTSGSTFKVTVPAGERVRYIVGARVGQKLAVSVSSASASLRLIEDAKVTDGINNFLAVLPKTGDYTVEIENTSEIDIEITVNIKIT